MKKIILLLAIIVLCKTSYSQEYIIVEPKINLAMGAVTIFNPGVEFGVSKHFAIQLEFFGAFAYRNFLGLGYPFLATIGFVDCRYYIKGGMKGFFVGASVGSGVWKMSRTMLTQPLKSQSYPIPYDVGTSVFSGASIGYKFLFKERWGLEISATGGFVHGMHEGYNAHGVKVFNSNATAEWLPYKGGIYLSYRLGGKKDKTK